MYEVHITSSRIISVSYISSVHSVSVYNAYNHKKIFSNAHIEKNYAKKRGLVKFIRSKKNQYIII